MVTAVRNNPVMLVAAVVAIVNLLVGDAELTTELIESFAILGGGLVARAKVTPTRKLANESEATNG